MGYFTRKAMNPQAREDRSYPAPTEQLRFRIEDLRQRLLELGGGYDSAMLAEARSANFRRNHAEQDIAYVLPEHLDREAALAALLLAENKLWRLGEPMVEELPDDNQLHIWGFYSRRTLAKQPSAA